MQSKTVVLGAGIAGISAGYHLAKEGIKPVIYEKGAQQVFKKSIKKTSLAYRLSLGKKRRELKKKDDDLRRNLYLYQQFYLK